MKTRSFSLIRTGFLIVMVAATGSVWAASDNVQFEEVSGSAGVEYVGPSWGSMWGDFNSDGFPDLWVINHYSQNSLFLNLGDETFVDIFETAVPEGPVIGDPHGAAWADFDNDGDQDLYQLADGGGIPSPARLFVNQGLNFDEMAVEYGVDYLMGRGRMPLWLDFNGDGLLDIMHAVSFISSGESWPTALFQQNDSGTPGFTDVTDLMGMELEPKANDFNQIADLTGDGKLDLLMQQYGFPARIFDISVNPFADIQSSLGLSKVAVVVDAAIDDFDGDLDNDLFMVRGEIEHGFAQIDEFTVEARFVPVYDTTERGISFRTTGDVSLGVWPIWVWGPGDIFIGEGGMHPDDIQFTMSPDDPNTWGMYDHVEGSSPDMYIGYDPGTQTWQILQWERLTNLVITSTSPISELAPLGWSLDEEPRMDRYTKNTGTGFVDGTSQAGFQVPSSGRGIVSFDYDNDMDLDLFVVTTGPVINDPDKLFENDGNGFFTEVQDAAGAAGTNLGRGDAVSCADFNRDGFLDLFVTNGTSKAPFDQDGPSQLFKNLGNDNHWLEIDLIGVVSNRDAVGAQLRLTAGGVTQLREQDGGIHYRGQNHQRVHFGLGTNTMVDELSIRWPSGYNQTLTNIPADQIIEVAEDYVVDVPGQDGTPALVRLMGCYPNPFNPSTAIKFSLAKAQAVNLTIHDAVGRLVNRLVDGKIFPAGVNEVTWTGRDDSGRRVSSGVYFYSLSSGDYIETKRMVLVK